MIGWQAKALALIIYGLTALWVGYWVTDKSWQAEWGAHMLADAEVNARNSAESAKKQQAIIQERDNAQKEAKRLQDQHDKNVADNRIAVDRLRAELDRFKNMPRSDNSSAIGISATAATDRLVLAGLLEQSHSAYGIVSEYADRNRQAVVNCNNEYNAVRDAVDGKR